MEEIIKQIAGSNGIFGLFLALSLIANGLLFNLLMKEKDKRLEDAKNILSGIATSLTFIKDSLELINDKIRVSQKAERDER